MHDSLLQALSTLPTPCMCDLGMGKWPHSKATAVLGLWGWGLETRLASRNTNPCKVKLENGRMYMHRHWSVCWSHQLSHHFYSHSSVLEYNPERDTFKWVIMSYREVPPPLPSRLGWWRATHSVTMYRNLQSNSSVNCKLELSDWRLPQWEELLSEIGHCLNNKVGWVWKILQNRLP